MDEELPLATDLYEENASTFFPYQAMSPQEYAGRYAHGIFCSSFDTYRYRDKALQEWIYELHSTLRDHKRLRECELRYYSEEELEQLYSGEI